MSTGLTTTETPSVTSAASLGLQLLAPPFVSPWTKFRTPAANPPGFWTAVAHDAANGGIVMQLGAQAHPATAPLTSTTLTVGYQRPVYLEAGTHTFTIRFDLYSVTRQPRGGVLRPSVFVKLKRAVFPFRPVQKMQEVFGGGVCYLTLSVTVSEDSDYLLSVGGSIFSSYQCAANPYAEIIVRRTEVIHQGPAIGLTAASAVSDAGAASFQAAGEPELDLDKDLASQEISPDELLGKSLGLIQH